MDTSSEKKSFLTLINENQRIIFKICNVYCKNEAEREDLHQEIIYQLWKSGKRYNANQTFSTWMYRVALNVAISFYRRKLTSPVIALNESYAEIADNNESTEKLEEDSVHLQKFIADLKELDRAVILLYLEEKTYKEIAEIVGISETNTATKINRIKNQLKKYFNNIK
jgi:RNA polymerase sigma factor (sigma-70 family)